MGLPGPAGPPGSTVPGKDHRSVLCASCDCYNINSSNQFAPCFAQYSLNIKEYNIHSHPNEIMLVLR